MLQIEPELSHQVTISMEYIMSENLQSTHREWISTSIPRKITMQWIVFETSDAGLQYPYRRRRVGKCVQPPLIQNTHNILTPVLTL